MGDWSQGEINTVIENLRAITQLLRDRSEKAEAMDNWIKKFIHREEVPEVSNSEDIPKPEKASKKPKRM